MLSPTNNTLPNIPPRRSRHIGLAVILLIWLALVAVLIVNSQRISDWWRLRGYNPPSAVVQLANEDTMTSYTRHLFYLNRPELLPTVTSFRAHCPENENTIVLGCYHPIEDGIYIYAVTDPSLAGVQQVTAAHEVLHAVYARLSSSQRSALDAELMSYYKHDLTDPRVKAEVKLYQKTEPKSVLDEMSCTFGTEIAKLPPALNAYYSQYFSDRQIIVDYEQKYQSAFTTRETIINQDDAQLTKMKAQIDAMQAQLQVSLSALNNQLASLTSLKNNNNIATYNQGVPAYNQAVDSYNASVQNVENLINQYNQLVNSRNQVAGQLTTLDSALNTKVTPAPTTTSP